MSSDSIKAMTWQDAPYWTRSARGCVEFGRTFSRLFLVKPMIICDTNVAVILIDGFINRTLRFFDEFKDTGRKTFCQHDKQI